VIIVGAILAAGPVHARLADTDPDAADIVAEIGRRALDELLAARLAAARTLVLAGDDPEVSDLATLLRRARGPELVAAAGRLAQRVARRGGASARAWFGAFGAEVLVGRRAERAAAVGLVLGGMQKQQVARLGGISRTTLDKWLADRDLDRMLAADAELPTTDDIDGGEDR